MRFATDIVEEPNDFFLREEKWKKTILCGSSQISVRERREKTKNSL